MLRKSGITKCKHGSGKTKTLRNEWRDQHKACVAAIGGTKCDDAFRVQQYNVETHRRGGSTLGLLPPPILRFKN